MRSWLKLAALPVALAAGAFLYLASRGDAATAITDITGNYTGKYVFKYVPLDGATTADHGPEAATLMATQTGANASFTLSVTTDSGPKVYNVSGFFGNAYFYGIGNSPDGHMVLSGKATGSPTKITLKGDGKLVATGSITTFKFTFHETQP